MEILTEETFSTEYKKCKTFGDFERLIQFMPVKFIHKLAESLAFVQKTTGLTMREDSFLIELNSFIKHRLTSKEVKTIKIREYDYKNQAWIVDGRYVRCGHPESMDCRCYGKLHEGEEAQNGGMR